MRCNHFAFRALFALLFTAFTPCGMVCVGKGYGDDKASHEIQFDLNDPVVDAGGLSTSRGGIVRGPGFHFEAQQISLFTNASARGPGTLIARGGVYIQYFGNRFVGEELEFDFPSRTGVLRRGRTQLGRWFVGGTEVHLLNDGRCQFAAPFATLSRSLPHRWMLTADTMSIGRNHKVAIEGLRVRAGQRDLTRIKSFTADVRQLREIPFIVRGQWGAKDQRRVGIRYTASRNPTRTYLDVDRWWMRGWGLGIHAKHHGTPTWSFAHYSLREMEPKPGWRYVSSGTFSTSWQNRRKQLEAKVFRASDGKFASQRLTNSSVYHPPPRSMVTYRQRGDRFYFNAQAIVKANRFETVKQLLPQLSVRMRPQYLGKWTFDQTWTAAHLKLSFAESSDQTDFAAWRAFWTGGIYRSVPLGENLTGTGMVSARIYGVNTTPDGGSVKWITPRWDGHLQTTLLYTFGPWIHRCTPYLHHAVARSQANLLSRCYVFDVEEAPTEFQRIQLGVRGSLSNAHRPLFDYTLELSDPIGSFSKRGAHTASLQGLWHASPRLDVGCFAQIERRRMRFDRLRIWSRATLSRSLAAKVEYDWRGRFSWRGIGTNRDWLQQLHNENELLGSHLSDKRQYLTGELYWYPKGDWVARVLTRCGFGRDRVAIQPQVLPYFEYGVGITKALSELWQLQLNFRQRRGEKFFTFEIRASTKAPTVSKKFF